ncbi:NAD(P)H-binding protein [Actinomadura meridiana]|uniref:NAD(P)H-binding protein n=1 Tax=Actinomadura meridiana TaxID=559626 RepID=A0ABP8BVB8_9ACTN
MTVLVIGATGKTGRPLVEALTARGVETRAASRNPDANGVRFDWVDRETWAPALEGSEGLYVVPPYAVPDGAGLVRDLLAAAPDLRRVVLLSVLGVDLLPDAIPMAAWEDEVRSSGKEWTILRPNWFQQNFGEIFAPSLREGGTLELPAADAEVAFIDTRDIADVAVSALTEEGHAEKAYVLTGPRALSHAEALRVLGEAADRKLTYTALDPDAFVNGMRAAGVDDRLVEWQQGLFTLVRDDESAVVTDTVERVTGHPARPLETFAQENAPLWRDR